MNGKKLGLLAAAVAIPLSVLAPAAADANTVPTTAVPTTALAESAQSAAKKPQIKIKDWEYNDYYDSFDIKVKYKCYKKGQNKKGYISVWAYQDYASYYGDAKAKCDGKWRYKWVEAEHDEYSDSVVEGDLTVGASLEDPRGNYTYKEKYVYFTF